MPVPELTWNEQTVEELHRHRLNVDHAFAVRDWRPRFFRQPASRRRNRPERLLMIGPDRGNRLLTFVLESPTPRNECHIVTGWPADKEERARYLQAR